MKSKEEREVIAEYAREHTLHETAEHFGYSIGYMYVLQKTGINFFKVDKSKDIKNLILQNYKTCTYSEMAKMFGRKKSYIGLICRKMGIKPIRANTGIKSQLYDRNQMIRCLQKNGFTYKNIGEAMGISKQAVEQIINKGDESDESKTV